MFKEIIVKGDQENSFVAVCEDQQLVEIYFDSNGQENLAGNIYKGRVENVLPGMHAAFVNIGLEKNGFLYINDAVPMQTDKSGNLLEPTQSIEDVLHTGQEILVQIVKEPVGTKGARISTHPTLPGRYVVLMPTSPYMGVSRRIEDEAEKARLCELTAQYLPSGMGVIIRTAAVGIGAKEIETDIKSLVRLWKRIQNKFVTALAPSALHKDLNLMERLVRDIFVDDVNRIVVDHAAAASGLIDVVKDVMPALTDRLEVCPGDLEKMYDIRQQLERALRRKVWLKCGGYIIVEQVEALTVIDVNTGKFVGETSLSDTVLQTNLEASVEIARQLRLRNIGGIIVVDFIDMKPEEDRNAVIALLSEELKRDHTKTNIMGLTQLGLLEMTRKKHGHQLMDVLMKDCPFCDGKGKVFTDETMYINVKKDIFALAAETDVPAIYVECNPAVAAYLIGPVGSNMDHIETSLGKKIIVKGNPNMRMVDYLVRPLYDIDASQALPPVTLGDELEVVIDSRHVEHPEHGIARLSGFVISVSQAGDYVGRTLRIRINYVGRTYARAEIIA